VLATRAALPNQTQKILSTHQNTLLISDARSRLAACRENLTDQTQLPKWQAPATRHDSGYRDLAPLPVLKDFRKLLLPVHEVMTGANAEWSPCSRYRTRQPVLSLCNSLISKTLGSPTDNRLIRGTGSSSGLGWGLTMKLAPERIWYFMMERAAADEMS
jgi:hypothetical protein